MTAAIDEFAAAEYAADIAADAVLVDATRPAAPQAPISAVRALEMPPVRRAGRVWAVANATAAVLILLVLLPVLVAVAIAVKLDGGPVLFRQSRVGKDGADFPMLKFRSMVVDAEARLAALHASNEAAGPLFKLRRDPRITRIGATLRKYSLDELPQLFNVVAGQMALVGPRPALRREVDQYCPLAQRRLAVKPGLTGLWQVSGRSDLSWDESIALDARYVDTWSPALDLRILVRTAGTVVRGDGAY